MNENGKQALSNGYKVDPTWTASTTKKPIRIKKWPADWARQKANHADAISDMRKRMSY